MLPAQGQQLLSEFGQHDPGGAGAHHDDRLLVQCGEYGLGQAISGPWRVLLQPRLHMSAARALQGSGDWIAGE